MLNWVERRKRIFLHFTPTSASWANLVERFFATLTDKRIRRRRLHLGAAPREVPAGVSEASQRESAAAGEIMVKVERGRATLAASS